MHEILFSNLELYFSIRNIIFKMFVLEIQVCASSLIQLLFLHSYRYEDYLKLCQTLIPALSNTKKVVVIPCDLFVCCLFEDFL